MPDQCDIAIVGGGAAGLTSAIFAATTATSATDRPIVRILEGARDFGTKILVSGGGRCNVTHERVATADFNGSPNSVKNILAAFSVEQTIRWFASMGVELKREETGKFFPISDSARTVLHAILARCDALDVCRSASRRVTACRVADNPADGFVIETGGGELHCRRLILATGGRSLPRSGSDGVGWTIAQSLGHTVTSTHAALVPLVLDPSMFHAQLAGVALPATLSTFVDGKRIDQRTGSLLWTHIGISGPVAMDASRHWVTAHEQGKNAEMKCNFLPADDFQSADIWLLEQSRNHPKMLLANVLSRRLPDRIVAAVLRSVAISDELPCGQLSKDHRRALTHALVELPLKVQQQRGWNYAEVTAGGIPLSEINIRTMESRRCPGLYFAGEILDCDGRIGGFNFQWAWATGYLAGRAAANAVQSQTVPPPT